MKEMREAADNDVNNENAEMAEEQAKIAQEKVLFANELRASKCVASVCVV